MTPEVRAIIRHATSLAIVSAVVGPKLFGIHPVTAVACTALSTLAVVLPFIPHTSRKYCFCGPCTIGRDLLKVDREDARMSFFSQSLGLGTALLTHFALRTLRINTFSSAADVIYFAASTHFLSKILSGIFHSQVLRTIALIPLAGALTGWAFSILTPATCAVAALGVTGIMAGFVIAAGRDFWDFAPPMQQGLYGCWTLAVGFYLCKRSLEIPMKSAALLTFVPPLLTFLCYQLYALIDRKFEMEDHKRESEGLAQRRGRQSVASARASELENLRREVARLRAAAAAGEGVPPPVGHAAAARVLAPAADRREPREVDHPIAEPA